MTTSVPVRKTLVLTYQKPARVQRELTNAARLLGVQVDLDAYEITQFWDFEDRFRRLDISSEAGRTAFRRRYRRVTSDTGNIAEEHRALLKVIEAIFAE